MWNIKSSESFLTDPDGRSRWFDGVVNTVILFRHSGLLWSEMGVNMFTPIYPHLFLDLPPGWHSGLLWSEMGVNILYIFDWSQSHDWSWQQIQMVWKVINTCDPHLISGSTPRVAQWLLWIKWDNILYIFVYMTILKVQSHFWLILTVDPDGLMVVMTIKPSGWSGCQKWLWTFNISHTQKYLYPHFTGHEYMWPPSYAGSTPRVAQWLIKWNGCKHFVYFCVCEMTLNFQMVVIVINTCDPHLISGSTPRVAQWLIMEWNGGKHFVFFVYVKY